MSLLKAPQESVLETGRLARFFDTPDTLDGAITGVAGSEEQTNLYELGDLFADRANWSMVGQLALSQIEASSTFAKVPEAGFDPTVTVMARPDSNEWHLTVTQPAGRRRVVHAVVEEGVMVGAEAAFDNQCRRQTDERLLDEVEMQDVIKLLHGFLTSPARHQEIIAKRKGRADAEEKTMEFVGQAEYRLEAVAAGGDNDGTLLTRADAQQQLDNWRALIAAGELAYPPFDQTVEALKGTADYRGALAMRRQYPKIGMFNFAMPNPLPLQTLTARELGDQ